MTRFRVVACTSTSRRDFRHPRNVRALSLLYVDLTHTDATGQISRLEGLVQDGRARDPPFHLHLAAHFGILKTRSPSLFPPTHLQLHQPQLTLCHASLNLRRQHDRRGSCCALRSLHCWQGDPRHGRVHRWAWGRDGPCRSSTRPKAAHSRRAVGGKVRAVGFERSRGAGADAASAEGSTRLGR